MTDFRALAEQQEIRRRVLMHAATINAKDHGARLNGTTDDYRAIQEALDTAADAGGGRVVMPYSADGFALSHYLFVPPNVTLDCQYTPVVPLAGGTFGEYGAAFMVGAEHPNDTGVAEVTAAANAHIRRAVYDGGFDGDETGTDLLTEANYPGLLSNPVMLFNNIGGSATDCHIRGAKNIGIGLHGSRNVEVTRNRVSVCLWQAVGCPQTRPADGAHVHRNYFADIGTYAGDLHAPAGGVGNVLEANELVRCGQLAKSQVGPIRIINNVGSLDNRGAVGNETAVLVSGADARGSHVSGNRLTDVQDFLNIDAPDLSCEANKVTGHATRRPTAIVNIADPGALVQGNVFRYEMLGTRGIEVDATGGGWILDNTIVCSADANDRYPIYATTVTERLEIGGNVVTVEADGAGATNVAAIYCTDCTNLVVRDNTLTTQTPGAVNPSLYLNNCTGFVHGNTGNSQRRIQGTGAVQHYANTFSAVHASDTVKDWYEPQTSTADPNGVVTSRRAGDLCIDTNAAPDKTYLATTAGSTVWVALN